MSHDGDVSQVCSFAHFGIGGHGQAAIQCRGGGDRFWGAATIGRTLGNERRDRKVSDEIRFVQLTPPGSACSIALGTGLGDMRPGSVQGMQLVVPDVHAARAELVQRGVEVSQVQEFDWGSFVFFSDPGGNGWAVQQVPLRR